MEIFIADRAALADYAMTNTLNGEVTLVVAYAGRTQTYTGTVTQDAPGADVLFSHALADMPVPLYSQDFNNLTLHTFKRMMIRG
jgi:hypothetical protein